MNSLPTPLLLQEVIYKLDITDILSMRELNHNFHKLLKDEELWKYMVERDYGKKEKLNSWEELYRYCYRAMKIHDDLLPDGYHYPVALYFGPCTLTQYKECYPFVVHSDGEYWYIFPDLRGHE